MDTILIAGLGNPGAEYRGTWHNLGFLVVEKLAREFGVEFRPGKGQYLIAERHFSGREIVLIKPTSYMNLSGQPILQIVEKEDVFHENILVVCDDINLPFGKIRIRARGSDGGHKGLASIIYYIGTQNFPRLRIGIRTDDDFADIKDYVLSEIPMRSVETLDAILSKCVETIYCFINEGIEAAMCKFNAVIPAEVND